MPARALQDAWLVFLRPQTYDPPRIGIDLQTGKWGIVAVSVGSGESSTERKKAWGKDGSVSSKASADGSFTVDVEPIPGSIPAQYRVVMKLSAGAGLKLSGAAGNEKSKKTGSASVNASARR